MRLTPGTWVRECPGTPAHPRRLPMAFAVGWMTTRVRLGRCSRIRRSAHGGTACARTAPSGTRRGSAELAVAGAGGRPCEHAVQVPAIFVHEPGCASVHQQYGGHSSCMLFLVRTVHTVQQTVDFHRYSSWDGCHAPVVVQRQVSWLGCAENCGVPQLQCLWPLSSSWTRLLCPSVQ